MTFSPPSSKKSKQKVTVRPERTICLFFPLGLLSSWCPVLQCVLACIYFYDQAKPQTVLVPSFIPSLVGSNLPLPEPNLPAFVGYLRVLELAKQSCFFDVVTVATYQRSPSPWRLFHTASHLTSTPSPRPSLPELRHHPLPTSPAAKPK
jgi:hypothetical protein